MSLMFAFVPLPERKRKKRRAMRGFETAIQEERATVVVASLEFLCYRFLHYLVWFYSKCRVGFLLFDLFFYFRVLVM